jgi:cytochrome c oxidase cbb3-type subunit 4
MISGILTLVLLLAFLGIAAWAWSARTQPRFEDAAQLPLRDEPVQRGQAPLKTACCGQCGGKERA